MVPANSIAKMHARFLPLLMRMCNWYSDDPDPTFILLYFFIRGNRAGTNFPHKVPAREPPIQCEKGVVVQVIEIIERKMAPRLKVRNRA